jgi:hypothetical protein
MKRLYITAILITLILGVSYYIFSENSVPMPDVANSLPARVDTLTKKNSKPLAMQRRDWIDTLALWNFDLDALKKSGKEKPIANIFFWRIKPVDNSVSREKNGRPWTPGIMFDIFNKSDSAFCRTESLRTKVFTTCVGYSVGGDMFTIGDYIFLNRDVCLHCVRYETGFDYCRPVLRKIVGELNRNDVGSLDRIVKQFGIGQGDRDRAPAF